MKHHNIPFRPDLRFRDVLVENFLIPSLKWLADVQDKTSSTVLPTKTGSFWESAYAVICLIRAKPILLEHSGNYSGEFAKPIRETIKYLMDKAQVDGAKANWDNGLFDTAVITRSLLYFLVFEPKSSIESDVRSLADEAVNWLCQEINTWEVEHSLISIIDLAQTLRTLLLWEEVTGESISSLLNNNADLSKFPIYEFIADYLLHTCIVRDEEPDHIAMHHHLPHPPLETPPKEIIGSLTFLKNKTASWGNVWNTSEALLALTMFYINKGSTTTPERSSRISAVIRQSLRYLELEHVDGQWGDTTSLTLRAYLRGHAVWEGKVHPQPHLVFKTLRWLCDGRQYFGDNSIWHSPNHTLFFVLALIEVVNQWLIPGEPLDTTVINLYDLVFWQMPSRTSSERAKRLEIQAQLEQANSSQKVLISHIIDTDRQLRRWKFAFFIISWLVGGVIVSFISGFLTVVTYPLTSVSLLIPKISDWQVILAFTSIWISVGLVLLQRWNERMKDYLSSLTSDQSLTSNIPKEYWKSFSDIERLKGSD